MAGERERAGKRRGFEVSARPGSGGRPAHLSPITDQHHAVPAPVGELESAVAALTASEERYRLLFEQALEGIVEATPDGVLVHANASARALFAMAGDAALGQYRLADFVVDPRSLPRVARRLAADGEVRQLEVELRRLDGGSFWGSVTAQQVSVGGQAHVRLRVVDVTARVKAQEEKRLAEARFRAVLHHTVEGVAVTDAGGTIHYANPAARDLFGHVFESGRLTAAEWRAYIHEDEVAVVGRIADALATMDHVRHDLEFRSLDRDGGVVHLQVCLLDLRADPAIRGFVWHVRDVSGQRRAESALAYNALHDSLTGLPNRSQMERRLAAAIEQSGRDGVPVGVLFIDIDRFTVVNDSLGHSSGDHVLRCIATRLSGTLRSIDCLSRLSADEFVAVVRLTSRAGPQAWMDEVSRVSAVARRILQHVAEPIQVGGQSVCLTASVGIALTTSPLVEPTDLLRDAEAAVRLAKSDGRNRFVFFDPEMRTAADERHRLERELRMAIADDRLRMVYQPIVDLRTGGVVGLEALLRFVDSTGRTVLPDEFLDLADESGTIGLINDWVLTQVTSTLADLQRDATIAEPPYVALNTTAKQVSSTNFVDDVRAALARSGADPSGLVVEITEHGLIGDIEGCRRTLEGLHDIGVLLALDDFGTGFSSLSYLHWLPFDVVKIDRTFVSALDDESSKGAPLVHAIIAMARMLDLATIAEGVETSTQLATLLDAGCHIGQGWGISMPRSLPEVRQLLRRRSSLPLLLDGPSAVY